MLKCCCCSLAAALRQPSGNPDRPVVPKTTAMLASIMRRTGQSQTFNCYSTAAVSPVWRTLKVHKVTPQLIVYKLWISSLWLHALATLSPSKNIDLSSIPQTFTLTTIKVLCYLNNYFREAAAKTSPVSKVFSCQINITFLAPLYVKYSLWL